MVVLTGDMGGVVELLSHVRVHADHQLAFLDYLSVTVLHLFTDPALEGLTDDSCTDVEDPLLGHFHQVRIVGDVISNVREVDNELEDLLHGQALVLWYVEVDYVIVLQVALLPVQDVLEEVHGDVVCEKLDMSEERADDLPYGGM